MSGHSKWATIKRQKGAADAKRSQVFTKLAKAVAVAARDGADPSLNPRLRLAVDRAKAASMPKDNIERAIQKGMGSSEDAKLEEVRYEAYGPGGVAFLIDAVTDNRNRSSSQVRHLVERSGGRMAEMGSVGWMFEQRGVLQVAAPADRETLELTLIEEGATDFTEEEGTLTVTCEPHDFETVKAVLLAAKLEPSYANIEPVAKTSVTVDVGFGAKVEALREALDSDDDVTNTYDNAA